MTTTRAATRMAVELDVEALLMRLPWREAHLLRYNLEEGNTQDVKRVLRGLPASSLLIVIDFLADALGEETVVDGSETGVFAPPLASLTFVDILVPVEEDDAVAAA